GLNASATRAPWMQTMGSPVPVTSYSSVAPLMVAWFMGVTSGWQGGLVDQRRGGDECGPTSPGLRVATGVSGAADELPVGHGCGLSLREQITPAGDGVGDGAEPGGEQVERKRGEEDE